RTSTGSTTRQARFSLPHRSPRRCMGCRGTASPSATPCRAQVSLRPATCSRLTLYARPVVLSFGVTVLPDPPASRPGELLQLAERNGFHFGWTYDSHILWQEPYPLLTLAAQATSTLHLGLNVTNPGTREPTVTASAFATLQDITGGRMIMGIGRGDSA